MILASNSPRRRMILDKLTDNYRIQVPTIDEEAVIRTYTFKEDCEKGLCVMELALKKALDIETTEDEMVVAADSLVFYGDKFMGKPKDAEDARETLTFLAGKTHEVVTGVCILEKDNRHFFYVTTEVEFYPYDHFYKTLVDEYIEEELHVGKAGSYGIQDKGSLFVKKITGDYYNVMGLPVVALRKIKELMLKSIEAVELK
ncbi:MAG: Maf family protein [Tissierellia bacterium]|nr:Maf family protein [Tissierellia bacterium]